MRGQVYTRHAKNAAAHQVAPWHDAHKANLLRQLHRNLWQLQNIFLFPKR